MARFRGGTWLPSLAAVGSVLAASGCCLPIAPFLAAAGFAGASAFFGFMQPYLIGFAVLLLVGGFVQAYRARQCDRQSGGGQFAMRKTLCILAALAGTVLIYATYSALAPRHVPNGQPAFADLDLQSFRELFNSAAGKPRVLLLLSPT